MGPLTFSAFRRSTVLMKASEQPKSVALSSICLTPAPWGKLMVIDLRAFFIPGVIFIHLSMIGLIKEEPEPLMARVALAALPEWAEGPQPASRKADNPAVAMRKA